MGGALEPVTGDAASQRVEDAEAWAWVEDVVESDRLTAGADHLLEDPRLAEVVRLVQAALPGATVQSIREYLQVLDDRREERRRQAVRALAERLPDPKPASLGRRLGPTSDTLAEAIVDLLRHERR